jgi:hypothetical protein
VERREEREERGERRGERGEGRGERGERGEGVCITRHVLVERVRKWIALSNAMSPHQIWLL